MNSIDEHTFSDSAIEILDVIEESGYQAWLVGGCIRDALMGRECNDIDIATSASWEEVERICLNAGMKVRRSGTKHGTVTVLVPLDCDNKDLEAFEVTTFRIDSPTSSDSRHPDFVEFTDSIIEDLARRDFTMNAMAWHPKRGLLDPFDGLEDIEHKTIRIVGCANARFKEDALRILRGCRFASQLGFSIEPDTFRSMLTNKRLLLGISAERITSELDLLLMGDFVHDAIMDYVDVLSICAPELVSMKGFEQRTKYHVYDVLEHTAYAVQHAKKSRLVRWAAFCHDMGKPSCSFFDDDGVQHFYGHAIAGARIAKSLLDRLAMSRSFKERVCALVANHNDVIEPTAKSVKRALNRLDGRVEMLEDLFELKMADMLSHAPDYVNQTEGIESAKQTLSELIESSEAFSLKQLAVTGNDIALLGVAQGPEIGNILNSLLNATIDGVVENDKESLLRYAKDQLI